MKTLLGFFIGFFFLGTACSKSSNKPASGTLTSASVTGYWVGSFSSGNESEIFKSDGSTVQYDFYGTNITDSAMAPYKATGKWSIKGDSVYFNLIFPTVGNETFQEVGYVNTSVSPNVMTGTYSGSQAGSFMFTKQ